jgi:DNA polymerase-1
MSARPEFYILDAHAHIYQAFHAIRELTSPAGQMVNAVYGFAATVMKVLRERRPRYFAAAFDAPGLTFRHVRFPAYKGTRPPMPADLPPQIDLIRRLLTALGAPALDAPGFEADDVIATLAVRAAADGAPDGPLDVVVVTTDKDAEQLIGEHVRVFNARLDEMRDAAWLTEHRGVRPEQVVDLLGLAGDASDNVPGVPGIGEKTAAALIQEFGSLEDVLAHVDRVKGEKRRENLRAHADDARLSKDLVRLRIDAPVDLDWSRAAVARFDTAAAAALFRELGFRSLAERLPSAAAAPSAPAPGREEGQHAAPAATVPDVDYQACDTADGLAALLRRLRAARRFAFDLETTSAAPVEAEIVGYAVSTEAGRAWYVPVRGPAGATVLDPASTAAAFRPLLEDPRLEKVGQNLKYDAVVLRQIGVTLRGIAFDTMVASYLLDPGRRRHNLDDLALDYLGITKTPTSAVLGEGAPRAKGRKPAAERQGVLLVGQEAPAADEVAAPRMDYVPVARVARYACEDADVALRLADLMAPQLRDAGLWDLYRDVEVPLIDCLVEMETNGVAVDRSVLDRMGGQLTGRLVELEKEIHREAGESFNVNSPKQLAHVLFEKLRLPTVRRTRTGFSTDQDVLEELAPTHRLPALVVEHRQLSKLLGTYIEALPRMISRRTGRIHTSFNQTVTATGRLSSSDPNLQNIPVRTDVGRAIREAFVPSTPGSVFLAADYSQIELRILAHLSEDEALVSSFRRDEDIHAAVASQVFGVALSAVTSEMRRRAKAVNFGIIYGLSPFGLSRQLGLALSEAEQFIETYFARYPGVERFMAGVLERAKAEGRVTTMLGRRRPVSGIQAARGHHRSAGERIAINTVVQGSAADLIKVAMNRIHARIQRERRPAKMVIQIHDELIFEVPAADLDAEREMVVDEMAGAWRLRVPLKVDVSAGPNWGELN